MVTRNRSRVRALSRSGTAKRAGVNFLPPSTSKTIDHEHCFDTTSPPPHVTDHALILTRKRVSVPYINGTVSYGYPGGGTVVCVDYASPNRTDYVYCPAVSSVNWAYWRTKALANMNPSNPTTDVPLFLFELREFPRMLRDLGRVLTGRVRPSDVPGGHLAYNFGWAPLVSDARKLLDFTQQTDDRIRYLKNLEKGHRVRRRLLNNGEIADSTISNAYTELNVGPVGSPWGVVADRRNREVMSVWFTANAKAIGDLPNLSGPGARDYARRLAYGLSARPSTLWDALPWSWLIDYGLNVGDYIEAQNGMTKFQCTRMCIMAKQTAVSELTNVRVKSGLSMEYSAMVTEVKNRSAIANPTPVLTATQFLNGRQVGILAALATASALRGARS